jgi:hypothetical protein
MLNTNSRKGYFASSTYCLAYALPDVEQTQRDGVAKSIAMQSGWAGHSAPARLMVTTDGNKIVWPCFE